MRCSLLPILAFAAACSGSQPAVRPAPVAPTQPAPDRPKDLSALGAPQELGATFELLGRATAWLIATKWDEMKVGNKTVRDGRATLEIASGEQKRTITLDEGRPRAVFGYQVEVLVAHETYRESDARYLPQCRLKVTKTDAVR